MNVRVLQLRLERQTCPQVLCHAGRPFSSYWGLSIAQIQEVFGLILVSRVFTLIRRVQPVAGQPGDNIARASCRPQPQNNIIWMALKTLVTDWDIDDIEAPAWSAARPPSAHQPQSRFGRGGAPRGETDLRKNVSNREFQPGRMC